MKNDYLECTIHNFKTHVSRYIRMLEEGQYKAMLIKRHNKPVGLFVPVRRPAASGEGQGAEGSQEG